jgi:signal peptidase II
MGILLSNVGCDQMSKSIVRNSLTHYQKIHLLDSHVMLTRVENTGAFLSLGNTLSSGVKFIVLILIPVVAMGAAMGFLFIQSEVSRSLFLGIGCIIGGGIGNIYDRFIYGAVTDFLHIDFYIFRTGIFNMADVSIMTGVTIILITSVLKRNGMFINTPSENLR